MAWSWPFGGRQTSHYEAEGISAFISNSPLVELEGGAPRTARDGLALLRAESPGR